MLPNFFPCVYNVLTLMCEMDLVDRILYLARSGNVQVFIYLYSVLCECHTVLTFQCDMSLLCGVANVKLEFIILCFCGQFEASCSKNLQALAIQ